ncbi:MAG TPA: rhodanese-like domain-containing protein, partial [Longimicrobiales bacterium]|nr:rhodanese-like domain-containing protein [Longimicrobiales bacterium]
MVHILSLLFSTLRAAGMRCRSRSVVLSAAVVTLGGGVPAPLSGQDLPGPVVDAAWLAENVRRPELVVLHVGGSPEAFAEGHLPGARYLELGAVSFSRGEMEDPDHVMLDLPADLGQVRSALEELGVSDHSLVVVTYEGVRRVTSATRVLWTLQFMGMGDRSALLDGGTEAWRAVGGAMASEPVPVASGRLTRAPEEVRRVDREWVGARRD